MSNGKEDVATVHLDDNTVGYKSVLDEKKEKVDNATNDEDEQKYSKEYADYIELYDIMWWYNLLVGGEGEWEKEE